MSDLVLHCLQMSHKRDARLKSWDSIKFVLEMSFFWFGICRCPLFSSTHLNKFSINCATSKGLLKKYFLDSSKDCLNVLVYVSIDIKKSISNASCGPEVIKLFHAQLS